MITPALPSTTAQKIQGQAFAILVLSFRFEYSLRVPDESPSLQQPSEPSSSKDSHSHSPENAAPSGITKQNLEPRKKTSCAMALVLLSTIAALLSYFIIRLFFSAPGAAVDKSMEIAERVKKSVVEITNIEPRVIVNSKVHYEQSSSILELALTTRETLVEREMDHQWLGSTKRIKMRGVYTVKSGFDLSRPFSIVVEGEKATIQLPHARILSSEPKNIEVMQLSNGLWNKINPEDIELEINSLNLMAREKMLQENINAEAEKAIIEKLRERLGPDLQVEVQIGARESLPLVKG